MQNGFLGIFSFFESLVLPVPTDVFLAPMIVVRPRAWVRLALITTITSVIGGLAAYGIGLWFYETIGVVIIGEYGIEENFITLKALLDRNSFTAIIIAAITIIPYSAVALIAGLLSMNVWVFIIASIIGRGLRYFVEGYVVSRVGRPAVMLMYRFWNWFVVGGGIVFALFVAYMLWLA
ncbi:MAG: VTT domain-containing protein [Candidatus Pacebacteria bacterium]|nr:VTT domain-containing protein [Candidatus Paceibacterota bacterium]